MKPKSKVSVVSVIGPLSPHAVGFAEELSILGYTPLSAANQLRLMAHLSRWLAAQDLGPEDLHTERVEEFLGARRLAGYTSWRTERGLRPLLVYLRRMDVAPTAVSRVPDTPLDRLLEGYGDYLAQERGVMADTVGQYGEVARLFLSGKSDAEGVDLAGLDAGAVTDFVVRECPRHSVGRAKYVVTALRSLLRYLHVTGQIGLSLAAAVPAVAGWRSSGLPKALEPGQVASLLRSCDRRRAVGRRDYAVLVLLARLGLRAGEVAALELEDLDWRAGELAIEGKGRRQERLPLPRDVGEALASYLQRGRPVSDRRRVFLGARAPYRPLATSAITSIVRLACDRAGLAPIGAHRLRHTAATAMLRAGAPLAEVGQVLRHRSAATTAIYAKVDRRSLVALARPWPGDVAPCDPVDPAGLRSVARQWPGGAA
ncbi:MAG: site-specific integrase [Acidobacteriota bacterium]